MEQKTIYITEEGLKKLKDELHGLKTVKRKEIAERIQEAKELGDLSENAEYIEAKEEQGFIESRVLELEQMIKNAEVISHPTNDDIIQIGSAFTATSDAGLTVSFSIVGSSEADPSKNLISNESPLGQAFLGHKTGESVTVVTPKGDTVYTIESIK
ncbi:MAG: transcription elongation factor GreA [Candidatus Kerfeldbacteria bacterium]